MPASDDSLERLRAAVDGLAAEDAPALIAEAREEARAHVRCALSDAFAQSMLDAVREQLAAPVGRDPIAESDAVVADSDPPNTSGEDPAWYVYGVISSEQDVPAIQGARPTTLLGEGTLAAVVSRVSLEEFGEDRLRERLADMSWVEQTARAHEEVLDQVRVSATVIPMRMCTVYRTESALRDMLRRESNALQEAVDHLAGKAEWGVKVFADLSQRRQQSPVAEPQDGRAGAAYMQRKRNERDGRLHAIHTFEEATSEIHERLLSAADDGLTIPSQRPEASGHSGDMILNSVYLVVDEAEDRFSRQVQELQGEFGELGLELQLTGPWPAYNFVPGTIGAAW